MMSSNVLKPGDIIDHEGRLKLVIAADTAGVRLLHLGEGSGEEPVHPVYPSLEGGPALLAADCSYAERISLQLAGLPVATVSAAELDRVLRRYAVEAAELHRRAFDNKKEKKYIPASGKVVGAEELAMQIDATLDLWLTAGRYNDRFEQEFAGFLGSRFAVTTNSGSSANLLAITALTSHLLKDRRLQPGDEVITVAAGFPTTVAPIVQNGLVPVFVDVDPSTGNAVAEQLEAAYSGKTKAVFLAHTLGNPFDLDAVKQFTDRRGLWLVEDNCDALGAKYNEKYTGTCGHIGTFSFYPAHHITMGEGGALVTDDPLLRRIILSFRDWGRDCWCGPGKDDSCNNRFSQQHGKLPFGYDHKYVYSHMGYNLKITDWQAACGVAQISKLEWGAARRRANFDRLRSALAECGDVLIMPQPEPAALPSWFGFLLGVRPDAPFNRHGLVTAIEQQGIGTRQLFAGNLLRQPVFTENRYALRILDSQLLYSDEIGEAEYALLPGTEQVVNGSFWTGVWPGLEPEDSDRIAAAILSFVQNNRS